MKTLSKLLLAAYLFILLWLILFKFSLNLPTFFDQARSLNLTPFANYSRENIKELILNFVVFIPFGLFLSVVFKQVGFWRKLILILVFSLTVESVQYLFAVGIADITDIISNTTGGLLGLILYTLGKINTEAETLDRFIVSTGMVLLSIFILLLVILFASGTRFQKAPLRGGHLPQIRQQ